MDKLGSALRSWGFFQATGHGISSSFFDELRNVAKEFFDLPTEEKLKYAGVDGSIDSECRSMAPLLMAKLSFQPQFLNPLLANDDLQFRFF